ncbi:unnamed protein product, partial [marine sediment metagenome]
AIISILFLIFRLKKADPIEITFVSIVTMVSFMFFSVPFIRYFQPLIFYDSYSCSCDCPSLGIKLCPSPIKKESYLVFKLKI